MNTSSPRRAVAAVSAGRRNRSPGSFRRKLATDCRAAPPQARDERRGRRAARTGALARRLDPVKRNSAAAAPQTRRTWLGRLKSRWSPRWPGDLRGHHRVSSIASITANDPSHERLTPPAKTSLRARHADNGICSCTCRLLPIDCNVRTQPPSWRPLGPPSREAPHRSLPFFGQSWPNHNAVAARFRDCR